jgi:hypothetical protein
VLTRRSCHGKYFEKKGLRKKRVLREIPWFGYFYFLEKEGGTLYPLS